MSVSVLDTAIACTERTPAWEASIHRSECCDSSVGDAFAYICRKGKIDIVRFLVSDSRFALHCCDRTVEIAREHGRSSVTPCRYVTIDASNEASSALVLHVSRSQLFPCSQSSSPQIDTDELSNPLLVRLIDVCQETLETQRRIQHDSQ